MYIGSRRLIAGALMLMFLPLASANGEVITQSVSVTATPIHLFVGSGTAPVDPVTVGFLITYDPTLNYVDNTADISLTGTNLALGSTLAFTYYHDGTDPFGPSAGRLRVGGVFGADGSGTGADRVQYTPATNDFWLYIDDFDTSPSFVQLGYSQTSVGGPNLWGTVDPDEGTLGISNVENPVPTPSTLAGLISMGLMGAFMWRRRAG